MSDTEQAAEDTIVAAVMAPDVGDVGVNEVGSPQDVEVEAKAPEAEGEEPPEEKAEPEAKADDKKAAEPEEDYIEVATEEGKDPLRVPVKEALAAYQERETFRANMAQERETILSTVREQAGQTVQQVRQYAEETGLHLQAVMQLIQPPQPPQPPHPSVADPMSPNYNPDAAAQYTIQRAQWEQSMGRFNQVRAYAGELAQRAQVAEQWQDAQRRAQEDAALEKLWPEVSREDVADKVIADIRRFYGMTEDEVGAALTSHKHALIARDALAYRAMMEKAPETRAKVQQAAPKVVRSNKEAGGGTAQARNAANGQWTSGALAELRKTGSDDAATKYFAGLVRQGKI